MNLLLDVGNTRLKWALAEGGVLGQAGSAEHGGAPEGVLPDVAAGAVWVAQVFGPEREDSLAHAIGRRYGRAPQFARTQPSQLGLVVAYDEPQRLGVDRWLMMLALWRASASAFCVVGAGTALTLDAVDAHGRHGGGFIAAGLSAHLGAVLGTTRFATRDLGDHFDDGLGRDTESCVRQGAVLACVGAIERGLLAAGAPPLRAIAGGDAPRLLPLLGNGWEHRPGLVLEGLAALAA